MKAGYGLTCAACVGLACATLMITDMSNKSAAQSQPSDDFAKLEEWMFPGADSKRRGSIGVITASDYVANEPFDEVWRFFARKLGSEHDYSPNLTSGESRGGSRRNRYDVQILNSAAERTGVQSATLIRREREKTVIVHISRGKDEDKTHFTLVIESK